MVATLKPRTKREDWLADPRKTLSPSALSSYEICGRRGQYYHDPTIPRKSSMGTAIGSAWHAALEWYDLARMGQVEWAEEDPVPVMQGVAVKTLADRMADESFEWRDGDPSTEEAVAQLHVMLESWAATDVGAKWDGDTETNIEIVASEVEVFADFGSEHHIFHGYLDRVVRVDGTLVGTDNKSTGRAYGGRKGSGDPRELPQAPLYAEAWSQEFGEEMNHFAFDVTTKAGKFQRIWVPTSPLVRAPFIERWRNVSESIALHESKGLDMPCNPSHFLCSEKWCDYYKICPMGAPVDELMAP